MKLLKYLPVLSIAVTGMILTSCENNDISFPDYEGGSTVYFAYQSPVRTLVMGEDEYDTTLDNQHKCKIYATMGGVYENKKNIKIDIAVDNSLCDNLYFEDGSPVKAMPSSYYTLADNNITLNKVLSQGVEVQFTDAYFADPQALANTYVIPVIMTDVSGADRINSGEVLIEGSTPSRTNPEGWNKKPMDYVLYCVKYINEWEGYYLRRGVDQITENGNTTTVTRRKQYVENDEVCQTTTRSLSSLIFPVSTQIRVLEGENETLKTLNCDLVLTFNDKGECTITSGTDGYTASGSGKFMKKAEKKAWGNKDRDALYLDYQVDYGVRKFATKDTLVARNRGIVVEEFSPSYKE